MFSNSNAKQKSKNSPQPAPVLSPEPQNVRKARNVDPRINDPHSTPRPHSNRTAHSNGKSKRISLKTYNKKKNSSSHSTTTTSSTRQSNKLSDEKATEKPKKDETNCSKEDWKLAVERFISKNQPKKSFDGKSTVKSKKDEPSCSTANWEHETERFIADCNDSLIDSNEKFKGLLNSYREDNENSKEKPENSLLATGPMPIAHASTNDVFSMENNTFDIG